MGRLLAAAGYTSQKQYLTDDNKFLGVVEIVWAMKRQALKKKQLRLFDTSSLPERAFNFTGNSCGQHCPNTKGAWEPTCITGILTCLQKCCTVRYRPIIHALANTHD